MSTMETFKTDFTLKPAASAQKTYVIEIKKKSCYTFTVARNSLLHATETSAPTYQGKKQGILSV
jgi:hypothetical protein